MNGTISKKECGKDKSLGAPGPLPESCLATYRDVFLATEYVTGGEEAAAEKVKDQVKIYSQNTLTLDLLCDDLNFDTVLDCFGQLEIISPFSTIKQGLYNTKVKNRWKI